MNWSLDSAVSFVATHGRLIDRRRLGVVCGGHDAAGPLAALDAYRNTDGGYGWSLEPDHRSATSQPVAAMHALEVLADLHDADSPRPVDVCEWLAKHSLPDGGVPFGLPYADTDGSAGHWVGADPSVSSLQMTTQLAAQAHRLGRRRTDVATHPWLLAATDFCIGAIEALDELSPYELMFVLRFLDAAADSDPRAASMIDRFSAMVITDGPTPVPGGAEGESLHLLDFTPYADAPTRSAFGAAAIGADLERLANGQQEDGGWTVDYAMFSPAAALEWRGYVTVQAVSVLRGAAL